MHALTSRYTQNSESTLQTRRTLEHSTFKLRLMIDIAVVRAYKHCDLCLSRSPSTMSAAREGCECPRVAVAPGGHKHNSASAMAVLSSSGTSALRRTHGERTARTFVAVAAWNRSSGWIGRSAARLRIDTYGTCSRLCWLRRNGMCCNGACYAAAVARPVAAGVKVVATYRSVQRAVAAALLANTCKASDRGRHLVYTWRRGSSRLSL